MTKKSEQLRAKIATEKNKQKKAELEQKLKRSEQGKRNKVKGASYESTIANIFNGAYAPFNLVLKRTPKSGGYAKSEKNEFLCGDLTCLNTDIRFKLHLECKNVGQFKLKEWLSQARSDCPSDKIPTVVFHTRKKEHGYVEDFIVLPLKDFINLVPGGNIIDKPKKRRG